METFELIFIELRVTLGMAFNVLGEPFTKLIMRVEESRHDEVKQCPKLLHVVLDGSTK